MLSFDEEWILEYYMMTCNIMLIYTYICTVLPMRKRCLSTDARVYIEASLIESLIHLFTLTHSFTHALTHQYNQTKKC